jgi:hypothetical protein
VTERVSFSPVILRFAQNDNAFETARLEQTKTVNFNRQ